MDYSPITLNRTQELKINSFLSSDIKMFNSSFEKQKLNKFKKLSM
jgi:hypothetical protein